MLDDMNKARIAVVGAGAWGTALASLLAERGLDTILWAREPEVAEKVQKEHLNPAFLPGVPLPHHLRATSNLQEAVTKRDVVIFVVPSQFLRTVVRTCATAIGATATVVSASKGIETKTLALMSDVLETELRDELQGRIAVLSGPSFAREVAAKMPTNVTLASYNPRVRRWLRELFHLQYFRVYTSYDVVGVELGGALKNVLAIAAGGLEGMGFGFNTQCALITRGLAEIARLGARMGANPLTFSGLSGMGDLVLTCMGSLSRNRTVGQRIGRGESLDTVLAIPQVVEGVETSRCAQQLAQREGVDMPIVRQVYEILHQGKEPRRALHDLLSRSLRDELS